MTAFVDRLAEPQNLRRLLAAFIALVTFALILAAVAIIREFRTAERVDRVDDRVTVIERPTSPTRAQTRRALDRAINSLTVRQRRALLDRLLNAATLEQLKRIRQRAKVITRRRAAAIVARRRVQRPVVRRSPARGRVPRPKPIAPPPPVVVPVPAVPPPPVLPVPALTPVPDGPGKHGRGKAKGHNK